MRGLSYPDLVVRLLTPYLDSYNIIPLYIACIALICVALGVWVKVKRGWTTDARATASDPFATSSAL